MSVGKMYMVKDDEMMQLTSRVGASTIAILGLTFLRSRSLHGGWSTASRDGIVPQRGVAEWDEVRTNYTEQDDEPRCIELVRRRSICTCEPLQYLLHS